jgi:hypothetical protein
LIDQFGWGFKGAEIKVVAPFQLPFAKASNKACECIVQFKGLRLT